MGWGMVVVVFVVVVYGETRAVQKCTVFGGASYSHPPKVSDKARRRRQYAVVRRGDATPYEAFGGRLYRTLCEYRYSTSLAIVRGWGFCNVSSGIGAPRGVVMRGIAVALSLCLVVLMGFFCQSATFLGVLRRVLLGRRGSGRFSDAIHHSLPPTGRGAERWGALLVASAMVKPLM